MGRHRHGPAPGRLPIVLPWRRVTTVASNPGNNPVGGARRASPPTSALGLDRPGRDAPLTVTTVTAGFTFVKGMVFDGTNIRPDGSPKLLKLDGNGPSCKR
jgi:hypothetical protein